MYEDSIRYYVRALAMNPKADNAWQYLRISLRYFKEKRALFIACLCFNHILHKVLSFAAVLLGMTCWKLVILEA